MPEEETIVCPVCDSEIPAESEKCPVCGVDLNLFDIADEIETGEPEEDISGMIETLEGDIEDEELIETIKTIGGGGAGHEEGREEIEEEVKEEVTEEEIEEDVDLELEEEVEDEEVEEEIDESEMIVFECPECGAEVPEDANKCPSCGIEFAEAEEFEEEVEEEEIDPELVERFDEELAKVRSKISDLRDTKIDINDIKTLLKRTVQEKKADNYEKGLELLEEISKHSEQVFGIFHKIKECKGKILEMKDLGIDYEEEIDKLKEAKKLADEGDYASSIEYLESMYENCDQQISKHKKEEEERALERQKEDEKKGKIKKELDQKIKVAKDNFSEIKKTKFNLDDVKDLIKVTMKARKEGDYIDALNTIEDFNNKADKIIQLNERFLEGKQKIRELDKEDMDYTPYLKALKNSKKKVNQGEYDVAMSILDSTLGKIEEQLHHAEVEAELEEELAMSEQKADLMVDIEEKIKEAENNLDQISHTKIKTDQIEMDIEDVHLLKGEKKFEEALEKADQIVEETEKILRVMVKIDEAKSRIKEMKEDGLDYKGYLEMIKEEKDRADSGEYDEAIANLDELIIEMEEVLSGEAEEIETVEKTEPEVTELELEEGELIPEEEEVTEPVEEKEKEITVDDVREKAKEIKDILTRSKEKGFEIEGGKDIINEALQSTGQEDLERALESLEKSRDKLLNILKEEMEEKMVSIELKVEESLGLDFEEVEGYLEEARSAMDVDDYKSALEMFSKAQERVSEIGEPLSDAETTVTNVESLIFDAEVMGIDTSKANELLNKAKGELDVGDWDKAEEYAQQAKNEVLREVPDKLKHLVKKAQTELKKAKISGVDVSKQIDILKRANQAKEDEDYEKVLAEMKNYKNIMKKVWR